MRTQPTPGVKSHSSFGTVMSGRSWSAESVYRYGFNGKEGDDEFSVDEGSYDFGARVYDSRSGRWWSVDELFRSYVSFSTYGFVANNPLFQLDPDGRIISPYSLTQDLRRVFDKLITANSVYQNLLTKFNNDNPNVVYSLSTDKIGNNYSVTQSIVPNSKDLIYTDFNSKLFFCDSPCGNEDKRLRSDAFKVALFLHEAIFVSSLSDETGTKAVKGMYGGYWHEGVEQIKNGLIEANLEFELGLTERDINDLAFVGMNAGGKLDDPPKGTTSMYQFGEPFKKYILELAGLSEMDIDKSNENYGKSKKIFDKELKKFNTRMSKLEFSRGQKGNIKPDKK